MRGKPMEIEKHEQDAERAADAKTERPPVELHNPFNSFDFEPTDGGQF